MSWDPSGNCVHVCVCVRECIFHVPWCDKMTTYSPALLENKGLARFHLDRSVCGVKAPPLAMEASTLIRHNE